MSGGGPRSLRGTRPPQALNNGGRNVRLDPLKKESTMLKKLLVALLPAIIARVVRARQARKGGAGAAGVRRHQR